MPKSNRKETKTAPERSISPLESGTEKNLKRKTTRKQAKLSNLLRIYHGTNKCSKGTKRYGVEAMVGKGEPYKKYSQKKEISFANYVKKMQGGNALSTRAQAIPYYKKLRLHKDVQNIRFKKDAKRTLQIMMIVFMKKIGDILKLLCCLGKKVKVTEEIVFAQTRLTYPPEQQDAMIERYKKHWDSIEENNAIHDKRSKNAKEK
jgi:hypothetical protein